MPAPHPDTRHPDTQWPRWEVFKQDTPKKPHQAVGSVHAADPEHALLTARNVFVRRPSAVSMWVARADEIFSVTQEQIVSGEWHLEDANLQATPHSPQAFHVFAKTSHKRAMTFVEHVGEVRAGSPEEALERALETFADALALAWWLVPASAIVKSDPEDAESWFAPAKDKTYKQQSAYGFVNTTTFADARVKAQTQEDAA